MRLPLPCTLILLVTVGLCPAVTAAQPSAVSIAPAHHPWGRFEPGAWKLVCVVTETLDEKGLVKERSTTETKTTLMNIEEDGVTLELDVIHEVAGKRIRETQTIKQGFHGELICRNLKVKPARAGQVVIEGLKIPCKVLQLECSAPTSKTVTDVYYAPTRPPYVLRRHGLTSDVEGENTLSETAVNVVCLDWRRTKLPGLNSAVLVEAVNKHSKGTIVTWTCTSPKVPGGVISYDSRELDKLSRVVRRSTLELINYDSEPERERIGLFGRRRAGRIRKLKPPSRYPPW